MKQIITGLLTLLFLSISASALAQDDDGILSIYEGSSVQFEDQIGYEELPVVLDDSTVMVAEGIIRRQFCRAPEGRSPLEIMRNYETAIQQMNGDILFRSREPGSVQIDGIELQTLLATHRPERGLATNVMSYTRFYLNWTDVMTARISMGGKDAYVTIVAGRGESTARQQDTTFYELITIEIEPMELGMVTMDTLEQGLAAQGRVAIYNIYFDTGESTLKPESFDALDTIAEFLSQNSTKQFLVVGHTDNVGSYEMNLELSDARAMAVVDMLINEYEIEAEQVTPVGIGPAAPLSSNSTEEGRARNRRVEIVEM